MKIITLEVKATHPPQDYGDRVWGVDTKVWGNKSFLIVQHKNICSKAAKGPKQKTWGNIKTRKGGQDTPAPPLRKYNKIPI